MLASKAYANSRSALSLALGKDIRRASGGRRSSQNARSSAAPPVQVNQSV